MNRLRFPIHPFILKLLNHFNIAPKQLMPNSWRIILSCMEIWLESTKGDMIRVDEFAYLYRLKESKEYGYYKLMPWDRMSGIVTNLPSSFKYWKSRFFFVFRDDWETLFCFFLSFSSSLTFLFVVCSYKAPKAQKQIQGLCGGCHEVHEDHRRL